MCAVYSLFDALHHDDFAYTSFSQLVPSTCQEFSKLNLEYMALSAMRETDFASILNTEDQHDSKDEAKNLARRLYVSIFNKVCAAPIDLKAHSFRLSIVM